MKLKKLKEIIDRLYAQYQAHPEQIDDLDVVITTKGHSIGGRSRTDVKFASRGFDWEHSQFRLEPEEPLWKAGGHET